MYDEITYSEIIFHHSYAPDTARKTKVGGYGEEIHANVWLR